jgi:hypothetical protein
VRDRKTQCAGPIGNANEAAPLYLFRKSPTGRSISGRSDCVKMTLLFVVINVKLSVVGTESGRFDLLWHRSKIPPKAHDD